MPFLDYFKVGVVTRDNRFLTPEETLADFRKLDKNFDYKLTREGRFLKIYVIDFFVNMFLPSYFPIGSSCVSFVISVCIFMIAPYSRFFSGSKARSRRRKLTWFQWFAILSWYSVNSIKATTILLLWPQISTESATICVQMFRMTENRRAAINCINLSILPIKILIWIITN